MSDQEFFERARRDLFPKMKASALSLTIVGEPDPKLCMELGAAILFDKPIIAIVPQGRHVPLSLRTIAHKIVEVSDPPTEEDGKRVQAAIAEMLEAGDLRNGARHGD